MLNMNKSTGELVLIRGSKRIGIFFIDGAIVYSQSTIPAHGMETILIRRRRLSQADLQMYMALQKHSNKDLLAVLLENNVMTRRECVVCLDFQTDQIIFEALGWEEGTFYFEEGRHPDKTVILISRNPIDLVLEGLRCIDEWREIRKQLPARDSILEIDFKENRDSQALSLTQAEFNLALLMNGSRTLNDLCALSSASEFDTCKAVLQLMSTGMVRVKRTGDGQPVRPSTTSGPHASSERTFEETISLAPALLTTTTYRRAAVKVKGLAKGRGLPFTHASPDPRVSIGRIKGLVATVFKPRK